MKKIIVRTKAEALLVLAVSAIQLVLVQTVRAEEFAVEQIKTAVDEVKAGLAKEDPSSVLNSCATFSAMQSHVADPAAAKALLDEGTKLCNFDVPFARAEMEVKKAEKARAADPKRKVLSECFSADWTQAKDALTGKFPEDAKVKELVARWVKSCPA